MYEMIPEKLFDFVERLRKATIGEPIWINAKQVFEYKKQSVEVVVILKLCRAAHGVSAMMQLCASGLFIDMGAVARCVGDCSDEVFFLLENFPRTSSNVDQFIRAFFESTIDSDLSANGTPAVPTKKIRAAVVRVLKGQHDEATHEIVRKVHKAFSGYVHANYAHTMEVYNGASQNFNLRGVPSAEQRQMRAIQVRLAAVSVLHSTAFVALKLGQTALFREIVDTLG